MNNNQIITIKVNKELGLLLEKAKKDHCINISALVRKALIREIGSSDKYNGGTTSGSKH